MKNYFIAKVRASEQQQDGKIKPVTRQYIVDALSYTEAEAMITEKMGEVHREFKIKGINKAPYAEIHVEDGDIWYAVDVEAEVIDETSGKSKKTKTAMLIMCDSIPDAHSYAEDIWSSSMSDFEVVKVQKTKIEDVFLYEESEETE